MTQHLRYLGPTTGQFRTGDVYLMLLAIDQERILLSEPWGTSYSYTSLAHLLQFWAPAIPHIPIKGGDRSALPNNELFT
ncbi:hypothetical protein EU556_21665 [Hymenobacter fodinae]|uniref:Uncharacterized protein n=1 Tax=Hymenobacter fodinae TaxID=2510796 RepID=A0A4Z0P1W8_9BACT|nr:hypothetical protein EU556_21665 [Hymenobacter fodinae]